MPGLNRSSRRTIRGALIVLLLVINFFPTFGRPQFRSTGSDPEIGVWRVGWPMAMAQYDLRGTVHIGPFALTLWPFEGGVGAILAFGWLLNRWSQRQTAKKNASGR